MSSGEGENLSEWVNPEYEGMIRHFTAEAQHTARHRGNVACNTCHGLRVIVMVHSETKEPFSVACSACNPGGV
ncbi:hypothetical protein [Streptomyces jumonjinensis]|uniref:hypothetical protein n=1 Tax=Streptomyces jumonjinensis TaxID=1945 RepID=UPI0037970659